jgi:ribosomal protein L11 methyltransferase
MNEAGRKSRPGPEARLWTKVVIETGRGSCEEVALFLAELTGGGVECVSVSDRGHSPREQVVGYLGSDALNPSHKSRLAAFLEELGARDPLAAPVLVRSEPVPEEDWRHIWRTHFRVSRLTPRLVVRPPWEEYVPKGEERVLEIDPGMAFGTGLHASTRLTLSFIDDLFKEPEETGTAPTFPETVLDIGVGTGILSMACARLGARDVTAIDNDLAAVSAAEGNIRRNGLERIVKVSGVDLAAVPGSSWPPGLFVGSGFPGPSSAPAFWREGRRRASGRFSRASDSISPNRGTKGNGWPCASTEPGTVHGSGARDLLVSSRFFS